MLQEDTPVEEYTITGTKVFVKRDDLYGQYPAPPLAKLRGAKVLLEKLKNNGVKKVGVFDTRVSKAGQGIAYLCNQLEIECLVGFPQIKNTRISETHQIARELGATLYPLKAGRTTICYSRFTRVVREEKGYMLPLGLVCQETVQALEYLSRALNGQFNSIVLSTGTGTIATGVALGNKAIVYGVSCGMNINKQWKRVWQLAPDSLISNLRLIPPQYDYYTPVYNNCPFPTSPYYDAKAWEWLLKNIKQLEKPILFWNIGV